MNENDVVPSGNATTDSRVYQTLLLEAILAELKKLNERPQL